MGAFFIGGGSIRILSIFRSRDKPQDAVSAAPAFFFGSSVAGKSVTARTAIQVSAVYACVRVIAETVASLPLSLYQETAEGSQKAIKHPLYRLLHDEPNPEMTSFVLRGHPQRPRPGDSALPLAPRPHDR